MSETLRAWRSVDRNLIALLASVIPGAGHLYKHHYLIGLGILIGGNALMIFTAVLLGFATLGFSLLIVPVVYMAAVAASAYEIPDKHGHHHWLHPWSRSAPQPVLQEVRTGRRGEMK